eukprot:TRINITY_DN573_c0_g4_i1.p1 TRINITY_DN573_c0_g4~~TRINITY_DN573_c0_g4_i1.p1  ORF type:complete len:763 (-),score=106.11 TRINITY_DN573_c0_g4_i1:16-2304(-)
MAHREDLPEKITVTRLSPLFASRGVRTGVSEIICGTMLIVLSNIVIFGTNVAEPFGAPVLLAWSACSFLLGIFSIVAGKQGWRGFPPFMFYWTVGTGVLVLVIGALSLTRFLSLGCKFIKIEALCQEAGLIVTLVLSIFVYSGSKLMVLYCVVMMRREIDHKVDVIDDSSHPRRGSLSSAPHVTDPTRTYGSTDSLEATMSGNSSTVVPLDDFDDDLKGGSSVLGPRLYMNEAQREMYEVGLKKFNAKPKRGIEFILQRDFMELLLSVRSKMTHRSASISSSTEIKAGAGGEAPAIMPLSPDAADAVAIMLSDSKVISPIKLGSYLGQSDDTATAIRKAWVARMKFDKMEFDKALRAYLTKLILPPETEKIDRLIESFARHYHDCNPLTFSNSDTAYVLAFGLLMLHTDAHNPNMKKEAKMTKDQFIRNMRGIDNGKDLPQTYLSGLFDRIVAEEMMTDVARKGYLWKHARPGRGGIGREWQKRYFVLSSDRVLYYYLSHSDKNPRAIIPLEGLEVLKVEHESRSFCFLIRDPHYPTVKAAKRRDDGTLENATHEHFLLSAETEAEQNGWIKSLRLNIDKNPFYTLIKTKVSALNLGDSSPPTSRSLHSPTSSGIESSSEQERIPPRSQRSSSPLKRTPSIETAPAPLDSSEFDKEDLLSIGESSPPKRASLDRSIVFDADHVPLEAIDEGTERISLALTGKRSGSKTSAATPTKRSGTQLLSSPVKPAASARLQQSTDQLLHSDVASSSDSDEERLDNIGL